MPHRLAPYLVCFILLLLILAALPSAIAAGNQAHTDAPDPAQQRIEQLLDNLSSVHDAIREKAAEELDAMGFAVLAPLHKAVQDKNNPQRAQAARQYLAKLDQHDFKIVDAFGQPIPDASVTITHPQRPNPVTLTTNPLGNIVYPQLRINGSISLRIEHPDYGIATTQASIRRQPTTVKTPLLPPDHEHTNRAARGTVLDPDGKPVPGVAIYCGSVRTPGEGLINGGANVLTDKDGNFRFYFLETQQHKEQRGELIPPGSDAICTMTPPKDAGLWNWAGRIDNENPATITLDRPTLKHTIQVESPEGGLLDAFDTKGIVRLTHESELARNLAVDTDRLLSEAAFLPGTYRLTYKNINYQPITIDQDSPDTLVFKLPPKITYTGQVIDGTTGEPIEGALVFGWSGTRNSDDNFAPITNDQWDALRNMPTESLADHPALDPIKKGFIVQQATRTDEQGHYELTQPIDETFWGIIAVDKKRMPVYESVLKRFEPDDKHQAHIPPLPLFPAAKVVVKPKVGEERISVGYRWSYEQSDDEPEWMGVMRQLNQGGKRGFRRTSWLERNIQQVILVPANAPLKLRFTTPYAKGWSDADYDKVLTLEPGQTHIIKEPITFQPATLYTVRVTDAQGNPVEGAPVRLSYDSTRTGSVSHNTDAKGLARLYVNPGETGRFFISMKDAPAVDFDANHDDPENIFELQLTEEQLKKALERG